MLVFAQSAWAITPAAKSGFNQAPQTNNSTMNIERGGTITDVNSDKRTIAVDGITYPFVFSVAVTAADNLFSSHQSLRKGMRIRFVTTKDSAKGQERVTEILIINRRSPQK